MENRIIAADIGGTNSRFAAFTSSGSDDLKMREKIWLPTRQAGSFPELLEQLEHSGFSLSLSDADALSFAVAGPVEQGRYSAPPLIEWDIDLSAASRAFGFSKAWLLNDFVAQACSCLSEAGRNAATIHPGTAVPGAAIAVLGAGTGLGKAMLAPDGRGGYLPQPSEGGHTAFPFTGQREYDYHEFLKARLNEPYLTGNVVVSGQGLSWLHRFLTGEDVDPVKVTESLYPGSETLEWGARFYGRVCRNYALDTLSRGGFYVAGGVAARTPALISSPFFLEEFRRSSTLQHILERIPVYLVNDQDSGLWGAAWYARKQLRRKG